MSGMMASNRNRSKNSIDNPMLDDGFYQHRHFKGKRRTGSPTGGRGWRRAIRANETTTTAREIRDEISE